MSRMTGSKEFSIEALLSVAVAGMIVPPTSARRAAGTYRLSAGPNVDPRVTDHA
jgi:hypothetical protein